MLWMTFGHTLRRICHYFRRRPGEGEIAPGGSLTDALLTGDMSAPVSGIDKTRHWRVACSCGFERTATTAWHATEIARFHVRTILRAPEQNHTWTIEEPPSTKA